MRSGSCWPSPFGGLPLAASSGAGSSWARSTISSAAAIEAAASALTPCGSPAGLARTPTTTGSWGLGAFGSQGARSVSTLRQASRNRGKPRIRQDQDREHEEEDQQRHLGALCLDRGLRLGRSQRPEGDPLALWDPLVSLDRGDDLSDRPGGRGGEGAGLPDARSAGVDVDDRKLVALDDLDPVGKQQQGWGLPSGHLARQRQRARDLDLLGGDAGLLRDPPHDVTPGDEAGEDPGAGRQRLHVASHVAEGGARRVDQQLDRAVGLARRALGDRRRREANLVDGDQSDDRRHDDGRCDEDPSLAQLFEYQDQVHVGSVSRRGDPGGKRVDD